MTHVFLTYSSQNRDNFKMTKMVKDSTLESNGWSCCLLIFLTTYTKSYAEPRWGLWQLDSLYPFQTLRRKYEWITSIWILSPVITVQIDGTRKQSGWFSDFKNSYLINSFLVFWWCSFLLIRHRTTDAFLLVFFCRGDVHFYSFWNCMSNIHFYI